MAFLNPSDFTGKYELHTGMYDVNKLQAYIDKYEGRYLRQLFGVDLYNSFMSDIDQQTNEPKSPNFSYIFNPFAEDVTLYSMLDSDGILEMLKGFIFFEYAKDLLNQMTPFGNVRQRSENSTAILALQSQSYNRYNEAIRTFRAIRDYIYLNFDIATGQIVELTLIQNQPGYSSGNKFINVVNGWVTYATIDMSGSGYVVGEEIFVGNNGFQIEVTQVGPLGELMDFFILHGGYNYNVGSIYQLGLGTGVGAQLEVQNVSNSNGIINGNALIHITAEPIGAVTHINIVSTGTGGYVDATDVPVTGGSGIGLLVDISADPNTGQVMGAQIGTNSGIAYQVNDIVTIQLGNNDASVGVATITYGLILGHNINPLNQSLTTGFEIGDRVRVSGNGNNPNAIYEVTYVGLGDLTEYNGIQKALTYWL
jgi:hypothetical protein